MSLAPYLVGTWDTAETLELAGYAAPTSRIPGARVYQPIASPVSRTQNARQLETCFTDEALGLSNMVESIKLDQALRGKALCLTRPRG